MTHTYTHNTPQLITQHLVSAPVNSLCPLYKQDSIAFFHSQVSPHATADQSNPSTDENTPLLPTPLILLLIKHTLCWNLVKESQIEITQRSMEIGHHNPHRRISNKHTPFSQGFRGAWHLPTSTSISKKRLIYAVRKPQEQGSRGMPFDPWVVRQHVPRAVALHPSHRQKTFPLLGRYEDLHLSSR